MAHVVSVACHEQTVGIVGKELEHLVAAAGHRILVVAAIGSGHMAHRNVVADNDQLRLVHMAQVYLHPCQLFGADDSFGIVFGAGQVLDIVEGDEVDIAFVEGVPRRSPIFLIFVGCARGGVLVAAFDLEVVVVADDREEGDAQACEAGVHAVLKPGALLVHLVA